MNGGTISDCTAQAYGSGVYLNAGSAATFTLAGGNIKGTIRTGAGSLFKFTKGSIESSSGHDFSGTMEVDPVGGDNAQVVFSGGGAIDLSGNSASVIKGGTFDGRIINCAGNISGGVFSGRDVNIIGGTISGGVFSDGTVNITSKSTISGGTFNSKVDLAGTIENGTFNNIVKVYKNSRISGGIFFGKIESAYLSYVVDYTVIGGTFYGGVNTDKISSDVTWYEVKFDTNGGNADPSLVTQVFIAPDDEAGAIKPKSTPKKDDYKFFGWYEKDEDGEFKSEAFDFANTKVTEDIILYAKWVCAGEHTGGTADCTHKAVCTSCGEEYGEVNSANHDFTAQVKSADALVSAATCQDKAVYNYTCSRCGVIENDDTHTFKGELDSSKHTDTKEWSTKTATQHEQTWKCCGATVVALEDHEWKDGVCTECGYACAHTGGTADCTHKAKCEVCGEKYGEVNADNHITLKHTGEKAPTVEAEGNIEYWHCEECGEYFSDEDGKNEITLTDTVIAKLEKEEVVPDEKDETEAPQTGYKSHAVFWTSLLIISGITAFGMILSCKKKKRFTK